MSNTPDIDNDEPLFQFDPYDGRQSFVARQPSQQPPMRPQPACIPHTMASHDALPTSGELVGNEPHTLSAAAKGKERTMPMPIRASTILHDLFDASSPSIASPSSSSYRAFESSSSSITTLSPASAFSSPDFSSRYRQRSFSVESMEQLETPDADISSLSAFSGKGKQKESYPILPPLNFSVMELHYGQIEPPTPGPSSYGTLYSPPPKSDCLPPTSVSPDRHIIVPPPSQSPPSPDASPRVSLPSIPRFRSLSNLSRQLTPSLGSVSSAIASQATFGPSSRVPSNLSRHLSLEKQDNNNNDRPLIESARKTPEPSTVISKSDLSVIESEPASPLAWYTASKPTASSAPTSHESSPRVWLKTKTRSQSSPYPISALDFIPIASTDIFQPLPIVIPNYFNLILPKELRLHILRALVDLHEHEYQRSVRDGRLTMAKAISSKGRWVGRDKGVRELFKLSRVSKGWQRLVFDGELWAHLDLHSFPGLPPAIIVRIVQSAGTFIRTLNFAGHVHLQPENMTNMANGLCMTVPQVSPLSYTQLTTINLQGCIGLTTRVLHHLLVRSKYLKTLCVKGLGAVTNTTCDIISNFCPNIVSLNMSQCHSMDAEGIRSLAVAALLRREYLQLKELRVSGLKHVTDKMMRALGRAAPYLEVLDLSYSRQLHNSALDEFVACDESMDSIDLGVETIVVSARDLGRETSDTVAPRFKRRVTRLRHLNISFCILLTDNACANLAHSVPKLEFFEMAGIGPDLRDAGLVRLLEQTPYIRRLDLEDASEITDAVISTVTPYVDEEDDTNDDANRRSEADSSTKKNSVDDKQPGHVLQHLNISHATNITDATLLGLVRNCTTLTVLEADNTRMGANVLKEFVRLSRQRKALNAKIVAIDCRGISESLVKELSPSIRPRLGWRAYEARKLHYLDKRDDVEEELKAGHGQDECDETRVVLKTFYSWQTVDAVKAIKEKRRKANRRAASESSTASAADADAGGGGRSTRWWSPGGRRSSGRGAGSGRGSPPILPDLTNDGCRTM
ncbi:unnamed protein product [Cyclocybe aegerita]|uniref:F-box domain-containing protein n=1 Tax=Cyclocybe aegerita TaxID=1973307 RepID=A0A8S0XXW8_CYCAE|nr:unnamed protein product [Cyclocybe aegerita]